MPTTERPQSDPPRGVSGSRRRWLWFFGLWLAGVAAVAALGYLPRLILGA